MSKSDDEQRIIFRENVIRVGAGFRREGAAARTGFVGDARAASGEVGSE